MEQVGLLILLVAAVAGQTTTQVTVTRTGCGVNKLCVETPDDCDPAANGSCLFASVNASTPVAPKGTDLSIQLRGDSTGYVALGLTVNASAGNTNLFICARNNSNNGTFFRTMLRDNTNNNLTSANLSVTEARISVSNHVIQCEFTVLNVNATSSDRVRSSHATTFAILLGVGKIDGDKIGGFNVSLNSGPLNLVNPASNVVNNSTTAAPNTTATGNTTTPAVLLLLSLLSLSVILRA